MEKLILLYFYFSLPNAIQFICFDQHKFLAINSEPKQLFLITSCNLFLNAEKNTFRGKQLIREIVQKEWKDSSMLKRTYFKVLDKNNVHLEIKLKTDNSQ